jgi:hypothetical protein
MKKTPTKYEFIKDFVKQPDNKSLLLLKHRFEKQSSVIKASDLHPDSITGDRK